jgi:phosphohistidine phosphatase
MKKLTLIRHAKASHHGHLPDAERPLTQEGRQMADDLGGRLADLAWDPDLVLLSPSVRTRETAASIRQRAGRGARWVEDERLYLIHPRHLLLLIEACEREVSHLVIIGHNPSISIVAETLDHSVAPIGTSGTALFTLNIRAWPVLQAAPHAPADLLLPPHALHN